jgi:hypothetical protein
MSEDFSVDQKLRLEAMAHAMKLAELAAVELDVDEISDEQIVRSAQRLYEFLTETKSQPRPFAVSLGLSLVDPMPITGFDIPEENK